MNIDDIFAKSDTFSAVVEINIPGDATDRTYRPTVKFRYLDQDQLDALMGGESAEIDGDVIEANNDEGLLDKVLVGWSGWKVNGEEIQYDESNHAKALRHPPIRAAMVMKFFERLSGGARGGKRGKRKN